MQKKKRFSQSTIEGLRNDADQCAPDAAKEKDFQLLVRSNDLRSSIKKKKSEIKELEKMEQTRIARKDSIMRVKRFSDFSNKRFKSETNVQIHMNMCNYR